MSKPLISPPRNLTVASKAIIYSHTKIRESFLSVLGADFEQQDFINCKIDTFEQFSLVGPVVGAPQAAMVAEGLAASGCQEIIVYGVCGALNIASAKNFGDFIVPDGAISEEGTSKLYGFEEVQAHQAGATQQAMEQVLKKEQLCFHKGSLWTTDAPYLESVDKVEHYANLGAVAVDMEFSALLSVCKLREISLSAIFIVSDLLSNKWENGFRSSELKSSKAKLRDMILSAID